MEHTTTPTSVVNYIVNTGGGRWGLNIYIYLNTTGNSINSASITDSNGNNVPIVDYNLSIATWLSNAEYISVSFDLYSGVSLNYGEEYTLIVNINSDDDVVITFKRYEFGTTLPCTNSYDHENTDGYPIQYTVSE